MQSARSPPGSQTPSIATKQWQTKFRKMALKSFNIAGSSPLFPLLQSLFFKYYLYHNHTKNASQLLVSDLPASMPRSTSGLCPSFRYTFLFDMWYWHCRTAEASIGRHSKSRTTEKQHFFKQYREVQINAKTTWPSPGGHEAPTHRFCHLFPLPTTMENSNLLFKRSLHAFKASPDDRTQLLAARSSQDHLQEQIRAALPILLPQPSMAQSSCSCPRHPPLSSMATLLRTTRKKREKGIICALRSSTGTILAIGNHRLLQFSQLLKFQLGLD